MPKRRFVQLLLATAAIDAAAGALRAQATAAIPATDVQALQQTLIDPASRTDQREQAAQRLLSRPDPAARETIRRTLGDADHAAAQQAVARALADDPTADPSLIDPLMKLLDSGSPEAVLSATGEALTAFKSDAGVLSRMSAKAAAGDERVRIVAIRALGRFVDKQAAAALIPLTDPTRQPPRVTDAANKALAYLAGLDPAVTNTAFWQQWWAQNGPKTPAQFQADLTLARSDRYDRERVAADGLAEAIERMASDQYEKAPREQKADTLVPFLRSPVPAVRVVGCRIARQAAQSDVTPQPVKEQLRVLVGDSHPNVRAEAARTLALVNDPDAVVPLLTQLNQESDPAVKAAIADALGPIRDARAIGPMLALLNDSSNDVAQSAAEAIAQTLADRDVRDRIRQSDPALLDRTGTTLAGVLESRTSPRDNIDLRYDLVQAMAPLQSPALALPLSRMLSSPAESSKVRPALLAAVGAYNDPRFTDTIQPWLEDADDPGVRLAAVRALAGTVDNLSAVERPLRDLINPAKETHADVRDAAWKVMTGLFAKAPLEQLTPWEIKLKDDPYKLLVVLREERLRPAIATEPLQASDKDRQIGDQCMLALQYNDAVTAYAEAVQLAQAGNNLSTVGQINESLASAYIRNRQYDKAIDFIAAEINKDPAQTQDLMSTVKIEARTLMDKDPGGAAQLIDRALAMTPRPRGGLADALQQMRDDSRQRLRQQNRTPYPASDRVETAMAD